MTNSLAKKAAGWFRGLRDRWLRWRQASSIRTALADLDDRTLRDLGLHRSEIDSVAAETAGRTERTRMIALMTRKGTFATM